MDIQNNKDGLSFKTIKSMGNEDGWEAVISHLAEDDMEKVNTLINGPKFTFPKLYLLKTNSKWPKVLSVLNQKNNAAAEWMEKVVTKEIKYIRWASTHMQTGHEALRWMIETGYSEDELGDEYDEIIDSAAVILVKEYKDKSILPTLMDVLFRRYRRKGYIYDLIWALYESQEPLSLIMAAQRLTSSNPMDVELARKLLCFIPLPMNETYDASEHYRFCIQWLKENYQFMYYTGESLQQKSHPTPYKVSLEAKYLCKEVFTDTGNPKEGITVEESLRLGYLRQMSIDNQKILADFSYRLYYKNPAAWNTWIHFPIVQQIRTARMLLEGS